MKRIVTSLLTVVMLTVGLNITAFGSGISSQTYTCDGRVVSAYLSILENWDGDAQYIVYDIDKDGTPELIIESGVAAESILNFYTFNGGETKWLGSKEGSHTSLATVPNKNGILRTSAHSSFQHVSLISVKDGGIEETEVFAETLTPDEYIEHGYYEPEYFYEGAKYLDFYDKMNLSALKKIKPVSKSVNVSQNFSTVDFDFGMAKGIQYFNNGQYYEARDEFQWFCDDNWGKMNEGQQQYALGYLNNAKEKVAEIEKENSRLTQQQFDDGMRKGIDYFNKGLWKDARNEFQWFCDSNWWRMNSGQRKYALDYLGAAKQNFQAATGWSDISESQKLKNRLGIIKVHLDYLEMMESLKKNGLID